MGGDRTERATPKRRRDERKKGNVFFSREIIVVASFISIFYCIKLLGPYIVAKMSQSITYFFTLAATQGIITPADTHSIFLEGASVFVMTALPLLLIAAFIAVVLTGLQTQMLFSTEAMSFKMNRLNPITGFKRLFSLRSIIELLKSTVKIVIVGYIIYKEFISRLGTLPKLMDMPFQQAAAYTGEIILSVAKAVAIIMAFVAGLDYLYQWWEYEKNLMMSKQEIKEEYKLTEGDPQIKGKIRDRQQQAARRRMMQNVPKADVVIRNPTHYAVAIKYDPGTDIAPIVLAKGTDHIALRIIEVAEEHGVTITENRPLARGLYEAVDIDQIIPDEFYQPVAEVLAFVYSLKKKELSL